MFKVKLNRRNITNDKLLYNMNTLEALTEQIQQWTDSGKRS